MRNDELKIKRDTLIQFLEMFAPFSRKTLGSIEKIIEKHSVEESRTKSRKVEEY
jgi:hypothetical protein